MVSVWIRLHLYTAEENRGKSLTDGNLLCWLTWRINVWESGVRRLLRWREYDFLTMTNRCHQTRPAQTRPRVESQRKKARIPATKSWSRQASCTCIVEWQRRTLGDRDDQWWYAQFFVLKSSLVNLAVKVILLFKLVCLFLCFFVNAVASLVCLPFVHDLKHARIPKQQKNAFCAPW